MKNKLLLVFAFLFLLTLSLNFVNAVQGPGEIAAGIAKSVGDVFNAIVGGTEAGIGYVRFILFLLIFAIISSVLMKFGPLKNKRGTAIIVAAIVSLLGVRLLTPDWINTILVQYGALSVAITTILPFIIFFYFVERGMEEMPSLIRRIFWGVYASAFLFMWWYYSEQIGTIGQWFYFGVIVLSVLIIVFEPQVIRFLNRIRGKKFKLASIEYQLSELRQDEAELIKRMAEAQKEGNEEEAKKFKERLDKIREAIDNLETMKSQI